MKHSIIKPLFYDRDGKAFVFWNENAASIIIVHGGYATFISMRGTDHSAPSVSVKETTRCRSRLPDEEYVRGSRNKIVASYSPREEALFVQRDGHLATIHVPGRITGTETLRAP